jgi:hypothetical protein
VASPSPPVGSSAGCCSSTSLLTVNVCIKVRS